ncbi:MAG: DMT family transporter [Candidatus Levyibacteriota bacterium]
MTNKKLAFLLILIAGILGGGTSAISKKGFLEFSPMIFLSLRFFIASIIIFPFFIKRQKNIMQDIFSLVGLSLFAAFNIIFFTFGLEKTTATISNVLYGAVPLLAAVVLYFFHGEAVTRKKLFGIIFGFIGVNTILFFPALNSHIPFAGSFTGNLWIGIGVILWSLYLVFSKKLLHRHSPFILTCFLIFTTAVASLPFLLYEIMTRPHQGSIIDVFGYADLLYVSIISSIIIFLFTQIAIKKGGVILVSLLYYLIPLFGFIMNFVLLGERLNPELIFGGILVFMGVFFVTSS